MKVYATSLPVNIPRATKWYEQGSTFDYFGGDQFAFSPSPPAQVPVAKERPPSVVVSDDKHSFWGYLKYLWQGEPRA